MILGVFPSVDFFFLVYMIIQFYFLLMSLSCPFYVMCEMETTNILFLLLFIAQNSPNSW